MNDFFRFPHTPHLDWLGEGALRDEKLLTPLEVEELLAGDVVVEEKIDGANVGFSTTADGELRVQNRGAYLRADHCHPQFAVLWSWLPRPTLAEALWPNLMLFGEWCYAVHSVKYDALPDWFVGFDVYDTDTGDFWSTDRRDELLNALNFASVPRVASGQYRLDELEGMLANSRFGREPMEGIVVRREADGKTVSRAKLVRPSFVQTIDEHWSRGPFERNQRKYDAGS